jgi:hypothetical protein
MAAGFRLALARARSAGMTLRRIWAHGAEAVFSDSDRGRIRATGASRVCQAVVAIGSVAGREVKLLQQCRSFRSVPPLHKLRSLAELIRSNCALLATTDRRGVVLLAS